MASVKHIFLLFAAPRRNGMGCDPTSQRRGLYVLTLPWLTRAFPE